MERAVIAIADQVMAQELRSRLEDLGEIEVVFVTESTSELVPVVMNYEPSIVFVHNRLEPGPVLPVVRDLVIRQPSLAVLVVSADTTSDVYSNAMDAGARGVLTYPFAFEDLQQRVASSRDWSEHMRSLIASGGAQSASSGVAGTLVAFAGAKGGVGATILATHLAWDMATKAEGLTVCVVDLDLEKGDISSYVDFSYRVSIHDLAKISDELSARSVADTIAVHHSGLHLLPAPREIRETEDVTPRAVRQVLAQVRDMYDVVIVDTGSNVTPAQAAAVEMADDVIQVITPDVPALRAARRQVTAWESLGVGEPGTVNVLLNRFSRRSEIQQRTVDQLVAGHRLQIMVPDMTNKLERSINSRTPDLVTEKVWWSSLREIVGELDLTRARQARLATPEAGAEEAEQVREQPAESASGAGRGRDGEQRASHRRRRWEGLRRKRADAGSVALETVAMIPLAMLLLLLVWQLTLLGLSFVWAGHAANAASRAASIGQSTGEVVEAAREAVPPGVRDDLDVSPYARGDGTVHISIHASLISTGTASQPVSVEVGRYVTEEP